MTGSTSIEHSSIFEFKSKWWDFTPLDYWYGSGNEACLIYRLFQVSKLPVVTMVLKELRIYTKCSDGLSDNETFESPPKLHCQWTNSNWTQYKLVTSLHLRSVYTRPYRVDQAVDYFSNIVVVSYHRALVRMVNVGEYESETIRRFTLVSYYSISKSTTTTDRSRSRPSTTILQF